MRKRLVAGTLVALSLTLASRVSTRAWAQKNANPPVLAISPQVEAKEFPQKKWRSPTDPQIKTTESALPDLATPPSQDPPPLGPGRATETVVGNDPMVAVDSFLQRNRKEADDSIKALNQEAETLRARLQKVEAALARWKGVANALNQDTTPPISKEVPAPQLEAAPGPGEVHPAPRAEKVPPPSPSVDRSTDLPTLPSLPADEPRPLPKR